MKAFTQIQEQIADLYYKLRIAHENHSELSNIEMLSSQGVSMREEINMIRGELAGLEWVINDNVTGDL
jgi:hypothetical protein